MKKIKLGLFAFLMILGIALAGCSSDINQDSNQVPESEGKITKETNEVIQSSVETASENPVFYFTANESGSISKIDASLDEVVETIEIDGVVHNVQVSPDGKILGATLVPAMNHGSEESENEGTHDEGSHGDEAHNDGSHEEDAHSENAMEMKGKALFFDAMTNELLQTIEVGNHPAHIVFTHDGKYALVANNEDNNVSVIDMKGFSVIEMIDTGNGPHGFRISSDSQKAYVANMSEDTVSVLNLETMEEERKITVGANPVTTGVTSDGKTLVATLNGENMLAIVDLETDQVEKVEVGNGPAQVYIDGNNQFAYVANQGTEENPNNSVSIVDLKTKQATATIETGMGPHGVVTSSDSKRLYVTNMYEHTVSVVDTELQEVIKTVEVSEVPNGISIMK